MSTRIGIYASLMGVSCAISGIAGAQDDQRLVVPLSDPSRPARLEIQLFSGDISVEGYDGKEIVIVADAPIKDADRPEPPRQDGLRKIQSSAAGLTVEENDNTVLVRMDFSPKNADLQIRVPRRTSVKASLVNGGDVEIDSVTGDHELANVNGDVIATDIAGSAVINATNGDVRATFTSVEAMKAMSFTSFNGDVDVTLPANIKANLIVGSQQGDVYTDFDVVSQTDPPNVQQRVGPRGGREVRVSHQTRYAVNGGGSDIEMRTFNGDVMIRKR